MSAIATLKPLQGNLISEMIGHTIRRLVANVKAARHQAAVRREERQLIEMIQTYEHAMPAFAADLRAALARRS